MNPEVKAQWITALRSGEYAQGRGRLERTPVTENQPSQFCCLGVLCDLAVKAGIATRTVAHGMGTFQGGSDEFRSNNYLPPSVQQWAGLNSQNPRVEIVEGEFSRPISLADANDDLNYDFNQIADLVERNL